MKVICINDKIENEFFGGPELIMGEYYNVIGFAPNIVGGQKHYILNECGDWYYAERLFAPLSSIDETEFVREYKTEKV